MATTQCTKMDTLLKKMEPANFSSYKEFIRPLLIDALANTEFTFDEFNYNLYALNKEIFNQLNKETTALFKFLHRKPDVDYKLKEWLPLVPLNTAFSWSNMETLLNYIEPSKVQGYNAFMQTIILEGISRHNLTFDQLNTLLLNHNKEIFVHFFEKNHCLFWCLCS